MANPTSNFGWQMPTSTDLVTDLPADFETFGQAVDTSLAELKGGTSGQVLSKASNTDMDFAWVTSDDANAIQNTIVDAKGDLIAASASDVPARLAVGNNGETLVADSSTSTGLRYQGNYAAGKNKIINGDFGIWQRGTSQTLVAGTTPYTADRFFCQIGGSGGSVTVSRETFTVGQTDVPNNPTYFLRTTVTTLPTSGVNSDLIQRIENVNTFAGQTATISFYAKSSSSRTLEVVLGQVFGTGGSGAVFTTVTMSSSTLGTSWTKYTGTVTVPSISGKTIGTNDNLALYIRVTNPATGLTWDVSNVQMEAGSVATAFQTATGTIQGELAACQRYYYRTSNSASSGAQLGGIGFTFSSTAGVNSIPLPVQMRVVPTSLDYANLRAYDITAASVITFTSAAISGDSTPTVGTFTYVLVGGTANRMLRIDANNSSGYLGFSAEL